MPSYTTQTAGRAVSPAPPTPPPVVHPPDGHAPSGKRFLIAMLAPMTLLLLMFTVYPFVSVLWGALHRSDLTRPDDDTFTGAANFLTVLESPGLLTAVLLTAGLVVCAVALEFALGLTAASLLARTVRGSRFYLAMLVLPFGATPLAAYLAWRLMLNPDGGQVNTLLAALGLPAPNWTSEPWLARLAILVVDVWQWTPFITLVMLAGLKALPKEIFEAASLDGATGWQRLTQITLPMLRPLIAFVITFRAIDAARTFDSIWIITGGGPGDATETLTVSIYRSAFGELQIGQASALGLLLMIVMFVLGKRYAAPALRRLEH